LRLNIYCSRRGICWRGGERMDFKIASRFCRTFRNCFGPREHRGRLTIRVTIRRRC
jgi:hypothetical protein